MKKFYLLFGIVTIGVLLLGSIPMSIVAQDDEGPMDEGPPPGTYDILFDLFLENNWITGPTPSTPSGKTNTNLKYSVTDMVSPLDEYFNMGFLPLGDQPVQGLSFAIDGDFIDSELFVKIVNDQGTLIDWQAAMMLGKNITISWMIDDEIPLPPEAADILDIVPENLTFVEGSAPPPFPVVKSTTAFSDFFEYSDLVKVYGYDGLPFFIPSIFYLDNVSAANEYWNEFDLASMLPLPVGPDPVTGDYMAVDTVTSYDGSEFNLTISFEAGNTTADYGNISATLSWDNDTGYLDYFSADAFGDSDEDGTLEANEQFFIEFELDSVVNDVLPISVGDKGEYLMNVDVSVEVSDLENQTDEIWVNEFLNLITSPINDELMGMPLLNYTIDSIDGLYYHIDGYMFDLERYFKDRFGPIFGPGDDGQGAQELPPLNSYYHSIGSDDGPRDSTAGFAINLFDASIYMNSTEWYEGRHVMPEVWQEWNETSQQNEKYVNQTHLRMNDYMPGVIDAWIFDNKDWYDSWNLNPQRTFEEQFQSMLGSEIHNGLPTLVEEPNCWEEWNEVSSQWEVHCEGTHLEQYFINNSAPFEDKPYYIVFQIRELPETEYTSYISESSPYMLLGKLGGNGDDGNGGQGAQDDGSSDQQQNEEFNPLMMFIRGPQDLIPMPARTPDWDIVGGLSNFAEGLSEQLNAVFTSMDFIDLLESSVMDVDDPGDMLDIDYVDFGLYWIENGTHAGTMAFAEIVADVTDNNTKNRTDISADFYGEADYLWKSGGHFDTVGAFFELELVYDFEKYPEPETTTTEPENTTTTTEDPGNDLSPGFELFFTIGSLVILPIIYKKKRH